MPYFLNNSVGILKLKCCCLDVFGHFFGSEASKFEKKVNVSEKHRMISEDFYLLTNQIAGLEASEDKKRTKCW